MRPTLTLVFLATACTADDAIESSESPAEYTADVYGSFEPLDPSDPASPWIGTEYAVVTDRQGALVCDETLDAEGPATTDENGGITLDMARAELRDLAESCSVVFASERSVTFDTRYLNFDPQTSRFGESRGVVRTSDDLSEWAAYASGVIIDGALVYHGVRAITEAGPGRPADDAIQGDDEYVLQ